MNAVLMLFRLRLRLLRNRLRVGSRAGRIGMGLLRGCAYLMAFAFLRFGATVMAETARDAGRRFGAPAEVFFFTSTLLVASAIIFVVNLLVFAAEEFDTSDSTRDTAFLLSLPLTLRQVVWAKSLLRSTVDVYGVFLLLPLLWSVLLAFPAGPAGLVLVLLLFFLVELSAILAAMALFVWTAQLVRYDRLEALRLALGLVLPGLASGAIVLLRHSVNTGALGAWSARFGDLAALTPAARLITSIVELSGGHFGAAAGAAALGVGGFAAIALACDLAIVLPRHALARLQEGRGHTQVTGGAASFLAKLAGAGSAVPGGLRAIAILVAKDGVLLYRRPVFLLTTVLFPLAITGIDLLSLVLRSRLEHTGEEVIFVLHASVYVTLLILPFLGAAQSFGQTEHGRIGLLQALPLPMSALMRAKVVLFSPLVVGAALAIQAVGEVAYGRAELVATGANLLWTGLAAVLATHVAVASAALFPIFEFGVLAIRGANMAIGGMLHFTVTAAVGLLVFPLRVHNKAIALALTLPLVTYLWRKGADRLAYYDEGTTMARSRELRWDEAYIMFGLYAALQVVVYVALLFVWDLGAAQANAWSLDFAGISLIGLGAASLYYVNEKSPEVRAALGLTHAKLARAAPPALGCAAVLLVALPRLMALLPGGGAGALSEMLGRATVHLALAMSTMAVLIAPVAEELFFRGVLYGAGRSSFGRPYALAASSLIFALMHWDRTMPAMLVFAMALAALYELTGTLFAPILAHAAFNASGLALFAVAHGAPAGLPLPAYLALVGLALPAVLVAALARLARAYSDQVTGGAARQ